uniref:3-beta hydroxysteroid dehydrogenase/isomerase domain-containing protein n=1 Tax=Fagus sylvatica TaxID=28930 RepID=A0A2N9H1T2_FAGSY
MMESCLDGWWRVQIGLEEAEKDHSKAEEKLDWPWRCRAAETDRGHGGQIGLRKGQIGSEESRSFQAETEQIEVENEQIGLVGEQFRPRRSLTVCFFWRCRADRAQRSQFGSDLRRDLSTEVPSRSGSRPGSGSAIFGDSEQTELKGASSIPSRPSSKEPVRFGSEERSVHGGAEHTELEGAETDQIGPRPIRSCRTEASDLPRRTRSMPNRSHGTKAKSEKAHINAEEMLDAAEVHYMCFAPKLEVQFPQTAPIEECKKDISYLTNLPEASKKLQVFHSDLNQPDSFNTAIKGCIGVFHLAHPMDVDGKEPEETVTKRAVEGTLGILRACLNSKRVKRVIYISSAATILYNNEGLSVTDESTWSNLDICRSSKLVSPSYLLSKTITERTALEFAEKNGLDLVTLVLPLVVGSFLCPTIPSSVSIALAMIFGPRKSVRIDLKGARIQFPGDQDRYEYLNYSYMVHIDDVASAQIFLLEYPNAQGRYICSSSEMAIHQIHFKKVTSYGHSSLSSMKLLSTGFKFKYSVDEMFDGAIRCCKEKGFL